MYGKLLNLSIEELEVEIEDIDIKLSNLTEEIEELDRQIDELCTKRSDKNAKVLMLRSLSTSISELILEKQKEEGAQ